MLESENIEFKQEMTPDVYKEVIAFANTSGGIIYIGIDDNGNIVGLDNVDETYTRITNGIRDSIHPDVTIFIKYTLEDHNVIKIEVNEGNFKPYYLKSKGIKPSGVYIRQGTSSVQASYEQIRQMIKESDGDSFDAMRSIHQDLTFQSAAEVFHNQHIDFSEEKFYALGLKNISNHNFTNTAWLLSDQCQHSIKVAVFADKENTIFKDMREFKGSILTQLKEASSYLNLCNRTSCKISGISRIEQKDYPEEAIREALLNAIIHRDYSYSGSIIINFNETEAEFISIGGLAPGLTAADIQNGISQPRNQNLADIFFRLGYIEAYGTGIRKIFKLYDGYPVKPKIIVTPNTFKIILPNMNASCDEQNSKTTDTEKNTKQMLAVIEYLKNNGTMNDEELQNLLNVKRTRAYLIARRLCELNLIIATGRGTKKVYRLNL